MTQFRLLSLFFLASAAAAAGIPAGEMPRIDGIWDQNEWNKALEVPVEGGRARLRTAGRALCLAVRIERPYDGERIANSTQSPGRYTGEG